MAFFGLTALGPQNVFQAHLASFSDLHIFSQDDWRDAFLHVLRSKHTGGDTSRSELEDEGLAYEDMQQVLLTVFRGSPPIEQDTVRFMRAFDQLKEQDKRIRLDDFLGTVRRTAEAIEEEIKASEFEPTIASEYTSSSQLQSDIRNNRFSQRVLRDKYAAPLTAAQEIGWTAREAEPPKTKGKKMCAETIFAGELIKNGIYY